MQDFTSDYSAVAKEFAKEQAIELLDRRTSDEVLKILRKNEATLSNKGV